MPYPIKPFHLTVRVTAAVYNYLKTYPNMSDGVDCVARESMKANLSREDLEFYALLDGAQREPRDYAAEAAARERDK